MKNHSSSTKVVNAFEQSFMGQFNVLELLNSSHHLPWKKIVVTRCRIKKKGELIKHVCPAHVITFPILQQTQKVEKVDALINGSMKSIAHRTGYINFAPIGDPRRFIFQKAGIESIDIVIDHELFNKFDLENINTEKVEFIPFYQKEDEILYKLGHALYTDVITGAEYGFYSDSLKLHIMAHMLKFYSSANFNVKTYKKGLSNLQLNIVFEYIDDQLDQRITLKELSGLVGLSQFYFIRLFKQSVGISPCEYIISQRIKLAKSQLKTSDYLLADIAVNCGFSNQGHFCKYFKKHTGVTPNNYRKAFH